MLSALSSRLRAGSRPTRPLHCQFSSLVSPFREGDVVLLKRTDRTNNSQSILTPPLQRDSKIQSHRGSFNHEEIIGKLPRSLIKSSKGSPVRLHHPTLAEYVTLTPRLVTPVYPSEANLIVSHLDIHVTPLDSRDREDGTGPYEIFEAGTGHGSLTLHLARAIHAANARASHDDNETAGQDAIVHTLDISERHSTHARSIVHGFRHGLYARDVAFHVGKIGDFFATQRQKRQSDAPFLSGAVLDLPGVEMQLESVSAALLPEARLAVFCPSVTQLIDCERLIKQKRLPLLQEQVVELGANNSAGRPWELRLVQPRRRRHPSVRSARGPSVETADSENESSTAEVDSGNESAVEVVGSENESAVDTVDSDVESPSSVVEADEVDGSDRDDEKTNDWRAICRPQYGGLITAGGFLGIWTKALEY